MAYNHRLEKRKFELQWVKTKTQYKNAGMSSDSIQRMYEFEKEVFCSNRRFAEKFTLFSDVCNEGTLQEVLFLQSEEPDSISIFKDRAFVDRNWIDLIDTEKLAKALGKLTPTEKNLLTLVVFEQKTLKEACTVLGFSYRTGKYKMKQIRQKLK